MLLAGEKDFEQVKSIFYKHKKWFPHVRTDYMRRMIAKEQMILEEGILITFHHAKRKQTIGDVQVRKGDTVLHQIANAAPGSGNAKVILHNFFESVRSLGNIFLNSGLIQKAVAVTGPAHGPRPASSTPITAPCLQKGCSKV